MEWVLDYWIQAAFSVIVATVAAGWRYLSSRLKIQIKEQSAIKDGMKALIRDRIIETYNRCMDRGYCPIYCLENVHALHSEYKLLGGNGALDDIIEKLKALPTQLKKEDSANNERISYN